MDALAGPYLASAALLVAAGGTKIVDPMPLMRALMSVGLRVPRLVVQAAAAGEVLLGVAAVASGSRLAAVGVAASYAVFTAFVLVALRRGGVLASCGCFGKVDTPPTATHVVVTGALAVVAAVVALRPLGPVVDLLAASPWHGLPLLLTSAAVGATAYLVLALLPALRVRT